MDNPQMTHATYQKTFISPNSSYLPWKNMPSIAKANRRVRRAARIIKNNHFQLPESAARFANIPNAALIIINTVLATTTFTTKMTTKPGRGTREWCSGPTIRDIQNSFVLTKCGQNFHSGPPLCRKYAIPTHGAESILDKSFTYRKTDIDSPSNAISSCPSLGTVRQHALLESVSGTPGHMSIATGIQRASSAKLQLQGRAVRPHGGTHAGE